MKAKNYLRMIVCSIMMCCTMNAMAGTGDVSEQDGDLYYEFDNIQVVTINNKYAYHFVIQEDGTLGLKGVATAIGTLVFTKWKYKDWEDQDGNTLTQYLSGIKKNLVGAVDIPETITYEGKTYTVTKVLEGAFEKQGWVKKVTFPSTLVEIGEKAFADLESAEGAINLPYGLKKIGAKAFQESNFTSLDIPETVSEIGKRAFSKCSKMHTIYLRWYTIPDGVDSTFIEKMDCMERTGADQLGTDVVIGHIFVPLISKFYYQDWFENIYRAHGGLINNVNPFTTDEPRVRTFVTNKLTTRGTNLITSKDGTGDEGCWGTMSTNVNMRIPAGVTVYMVNGIDTDNGIVTLKKVGAGDETDTGVIPPGAYIIKSDTAITDAFFREYTRTRDKKYKSDSYLEQVIEELRENGKLQMHLNTIPVGTKGGYISDADAAEADPLLTELPANFGGGMIAADSIPYTYNEEDSLVLDSTNVYPAGTRFWVLARYKADNYTKADPKYNFGFCYQNKKWWLYGTKEKNKMEQGSAVYAVNTRAFLPIRPDVQAKLSAFSVLGFQVDDTDDSTTGIEEVNTSARNIDNEKVYDLSGRLLNGVPERGVYIKGGKKYVK